MLNIALIAHDGKKPEMVSFVIKNKKFLDGTTIYATGTTGGHIEKEGFNVVAGYDIDESCKYPYEANNNSTFYPKDVEKLNGEELNQHFEDCDIKIPVSRSYVPAFRNI